MLRRIDKYKKSLSKLTTIKTSLSSVIRNKNNIEYINSVVKNVNLLVYHVYNFIKMYYLYNYERDERIIIDKSLIANIFNVLMVVSGPPYPFKCI